MPVTLVAGTSTGIGVATALHFARLGHPVIATMRNLAKAGPLQDAARAALAHEVAAFGIRWPSSSPASSRPPSSRTRRAPPATTGLPPTARSCAATASSSRPASGTRAGPRPSRRSSSKPSGPGRRTRPDDEHWVALGGELSDEEYNARFKRYFGIDL